MNNWFYFKDPADIMIVHLVGPDEFLMPEDFAGEDSADLI